MHVLVGFVGHNSSGVSIKGPGASRWRMGAPTTQTAKLATAVLMNSIAECPIRWCLASRVMWVELLIVFWPRGVIVANCKEQHWILLVESLASQLR